MPRQNAADLFSGLWGMAHPTGPQLSNDYNDKEGLTRVFVVTEFCAVPGCLANHESALSSYRALHLIHALGLRPELAAMLASLAFGGAA